KREGGLVSQSRTDYPSCIRAGLDASLMLGSELTVASTEPKAELDFLESFRPLAGASTSQGAFAASVHLEIPIAFLSAKAAHEPGSTRRRHALPVVLVLVLVPLSIFTALAVPVALGSSVPGDEPIYRFLHAHALVPGPMADLLASRAIELIGACLIAAVLLGLVFVGRIRATVLVVTALLPLALIPVLKSLFERAAPQSGPTNAGAL